MKEKAVKTNAMRLLDAAGVKYETDKYEVDEDDLSGTHAAEMMGADADTVFKTLVTKNAAGEARVFVIPVAYELDLKKCAAESGDKSLAMLHQKELLPLTGYVRGGCSPIGMKKKFPTYIDESALLFDLIRVSAGMRGLQLVIAPDDLAAFVGAKFCDITA